MADRAIGAEPATILERDGEVQAVEEIAARALSGSGGALLFEGPPGIGKSALLELAGELAAAQGLCVLSARSLPIESTFPFGIVRQLFEPRLAAATPARRRAMLAGAAQLSLSVFEPSKDARLSGNEESPATRHGLFWLASNLAAESPLCLIVDDAQWADAPSLAWLLHLTNRIAELPVMLAVAMRPADPAAPGPALLELRGLPDVLSRIPRPLSVDATAALVRATLGAEVSDSACRACHTATGGNPLLARELAHALAERGASADLRPEEVSDFGPEGVAAAVERRLSRLPPATLELARALAILGNNAEIPEAAALSGLQAAEAEAAVDSLVAAGVLAPGRRLQFVHPVVRVAVEDAIPPGSRSSLHRRAISLLREQRAEAERVAAHLLALPPRSDPEALESLRGAAEAAVARGAPEVAAVHLRRALEEHPPEQLRAELLHSLGLAEMATREPDALTHLRDAVLSAPEADRPAYAMDGAGPVGLSGNHAGAVALCRLGLAESPPKRLREQLEAELLLNMTTAAHLIGGLDELPGGEPDGDLLPQLAIARGYVSMLGGQRLEPLADRAERLLPEVVGEAIPLTASILQLGWADRLDPAIEVLDRRVSAARELGSPNLVAHYGCFRGFVHLRAGRLAEAEGDLSQSVAFNLEDPRPEAMSWPLAWLLEVAADRQVEPDLADADARIGSLGDWFGSALVVDARGIAALARDRPEEALNQFADSAERWRELGVTGPPVTSWRVGRAHALARLGEPAQAVGLAEEHAELARRCGSTRELGKGLHALGVAKGGTEEVELLRESVETLARSPARLDLAHAQAALGESLRRAGRRTDARDPLRVSLDLAERCGATALATRVREALRAAGARPRTPYLKGAEALTASERRVAELAAGGRTNREIAAALFISQNTVETHLRAVFRKLEISTRAEIAANLE